MITIRKSNERGHFDHGWLNTFHTFSFGDYHDPKYMAFRSLRVMNEDFVAAGQGFGMHGHRDMEIITYVLEVSLEHRDSMGNGSTLQAGDFQRMTAGTGVRHSEFNPSSDRSLHLYQIWLLPEKSGLAPGYEELRAGTQNRQNGLQLVASRHGRDSSLVVHQDVNIFLANLKSNESVTHILAPERHAWLQVLRGEVNIYGHQLAAGDGAAFSDESTLTARGVSTAEIMLFDLG